MLKDIEKAKETRRTYDELKALEALIYWKEYTGKEPEKHKMELEREFGVSLKELEERFKGVTIDELKERKAKLERENKKLMSLVKEKYGIAPFETLTCYNLLKCTVKTIYHFLKELEKAKG